MAEYLVYNKEHWVDELIKKSSPKLNDIDLTKFETRYKKGDIIQVYENGTCTEEPSPNSPFIIIKCSEQKIDYKYQEENRKQKTQKELDDELIEKEEIINTIVDKVMADNPLFNRNEIRLQITNEYIEPTKLINRRKYYFNMSQINTLQNKAIEITTSQFNNLIKSK